MQLKALGEQAERFSDAEFEVLKAIESKADGEDLLSGAEFDESARRTESRWKDQAGATGCSTFSTSWAS